MFDHKKPLYHYYFIVDILSSTWNKDEGTQKVLCKFPGSKITSQIAKFMEPSWGPPGSCRSQMAPCWPHETCYQGSDKRIMLCKGLPPHQRSLDASGSWCLHMTAGSGGGDLGDIWQMVYELTIWSLQTSVLFWCVIWLVDQGPFPVSYLE